MSVKDFSAAPPSAADLLEADAKASRDILAQSAQADRDLFASYAKADADLLEENRRMGQKLIDDYAVILHNPDLALDHKDLNGRGIDSTGSTLTDLTPEDPIIEDEPAPSGDGTIHIYRRGATDLIPDGQGDSHSEDNTDQNDNDLSIDVTEVPEAPGDKLVRLLYDKFGKKKTGSHRCVTAIYDENGNVISQFEPGLIDERGGAYDDGVLDELINKLLGISVEDTSFYSDPLPEPPKPEPSLTAAEMFDMIRYKPKKGEEGDIIDVKVCCGGGAAPTPVTPTPTPTPTEPLRPKVLDIVFVIDTTGSMSDKLTAIKNNISAYVDALKAKGIDMRLGLVAYGDTYIGEKMVKNDFTTSVDTFKGWLGSIKRFNGGDYPESTLDAINDTTAGAKSFAFRENADREYIVVTDALSHSKEDGWLTDGKSVYTVANTVKSLLADHVRTNVISVKGGDQETQLKPLADKTGGTFMDIKGDFGKQLLTLAANSDAGFYKPVPA